MDVPDRMQLGLLEAIFAPYMGVYEEAAREFVRGLLFQAGASPSTFRGIQAFPASPWWAIGIGTACHGIDRRDATRQVPDVQPSELVNRLWAIDNFVPRPAMSVGQTWLFTNGQSALVTQSSLLSCHRGRGYAHLAGEGLVRLEGPDVPPTWHPPRWVGDPPIPLVLLAGPSPWGRDVPWVDWEQWPVCWEALGRLLEVLPPVGDGKPYQIVLDGGGMKEPKL